MGTKKESETILSREEILTELLMSIKLEVPKVHTISLVSTGGHHIASTQPEPGEDEIVLSAMTAALLSIAEQASLKLDRGKPNNLIIECPKGLIILERINENVLIAVITEEGVRLAELQCALSKAQSKLYQLLEASPTV